MSVRAGSALHRRASIVSRTAAVVVGAYAVASLLTAVVALVLPLSPRDAVTAATMVGLFAWAVIAMAVFHARSAARAWAWLAGTALPLGMAVWLLLPGAPT